MCIKLKPVTTLDYEMVKTVGQMNLSKIQTVTENGHGDWTFAHEHYFPDFSPLHKRALRYTFIRYYAHVYNFCLFSLSTVSTALCLLISVYGSCA